MLSGWIFWTFFAIFSRDMETFLDTVKIIEYLFECFLVFIAQWPTFIFWSLKLWQAYCWPLTHNQDFSFIFSLQNHCHHQREHQKASKGDLKKIIEPYLAKSELAIIKFLVYKFIISSKKGSQKRKYL